MFGATDIGKNCDKEKCVYPGYGIAFDGKGLWNIGNDSARNILIFGVGNSSSSQADNCKNDFLVLGKKPTYSINGSFGSPEKKFNITLSKARKKFC